MSLQNWLDARFLTEHRSSREEIRDLLAVADRDLRDAAVREVSADRRFGIAYNAIRQLALLALAAEGYRPERQRAHERAIQSLRLTVGLEQDLVDTLDVVRRRRHLADYERAGTTTDDEADEVYGLALEIQDRVLRWMLRVHPGLLPRGENGPV